MAFFSTVEEKKWPHTDPVTLECLKGFRVPDTAGEEYEENQTKINKYTIRNPLPNYTSPPPTVFSFIPLVI